MEVRNMPAWEELGLPPHVNPSWGPWVLVPKPTGYWQTAVGVLCLPTTITVCWGCLYSLSLFLAQCAEGCLYSLSPNKMGFGFFIWLWRPGGKVYFPLGSLILSFFFFFFFNSTMVVSLGNFPGDIWPKVCNMQNNSSKKFLTVKTMFAYREYVGGWGQGRLGDLIFNDMPFNFIWIKGKEKRKKWKNKKLGRKEGERRKLLQRSLTIMPYSCNHNYIIYLLVSVDYIY